MAHDHQQDAYSSGGVGRFVFALLIVGAVLAISATALMYVLARDAFTAWFST
jgi:hypothetical protein